MKTQIEKCFYCGENICDRGAIRYGASNDDNLVIVFHDYCAIRIGTELADMGRRGLEIVQRN